MMPGRTLHRVASRLCSSKTLERVVEPAIADLQKEYGDAYACAPFRRARVLLTGYAGLWEVILMTALQMSPVDADRRALLRTFMWAATAVMCASALLIALTIAAVPVFAPFYIALLTPMTLPIALPIGLTLGIAFELGDGPVSRHARRVVVCAAILVTVMSFSSMAWVKPVANQAFRQSVFNAIGGKGTVMKGLNEMSLSEFRREMHMAPRGVLGDTPQRARWVYHLLFALPVAPTVLAVLGLALIARGVRKATVMAMSVAYFVVLMSGEALVYQGLPPAAAAWMPNVLFAAIALYFSLSRPSSMQTSLSPA